VGVAVHVVVLLGGAGVAVWQSTPTTAGDDAAITVSSSSCGQGWTDPKPGARTLQLHNADSVTAEADLPDLQIDQGDLGLRAHEIMENALDCARCSSRVCRNCLTWTPG
jgi:hypothetical protein